MKICIPSGGNMKGRNEPVFGRLEGAPFIAVADTETGALEFRPGGVTPSSVIRAGVMAVVSGGLVPGTVELFRTAGIASYRPSGGTVGETFERFLMGGLEPYGAGSAGNAG